MKRKDITIGIIIALAGLLLYFGLCQIMGYPLVTHTKSIRYIRPINTGHENHLIPSINILLPDSSTYVNIATPIESKSIALFYFSPYCPYCQSQTQEITNNIKSLKNIHFYLITIYSHNEMKEFYHKYKLEAYSNITVGYDFEFRFPAYFNTQMTPYIALYDRNLRLKSAFLGNLSHEQIKYVSKN